MGIFSGLSNSEMEPVDELIRDAEVLDDAPPVQENDAPPSPENNVKFVGKRKVLSKETGEPELVSIEASELINDGDTLIELPESDVQKAGFYHEQAGVLVALFPDDYKLIVPKG